MCPFVEFVSLVVLNAGLSQLLVNIKKARWDKPLFL